MNNRRYRLFLIWCLVAVMFLQINPAKASAAKVKVKGIKIAAPYQKKISLIKGEKKRISAKALTNSSNKSAKKVKFKSKNPGIVSVSNKGLVKAKKEGKTMIVVSSVLNKKKKTTIKVVVEDNIIKNDYDKETEVTNIIKSDKLSAVPVDTSVKNESTADDTVVEESENTDLDSGQLKIESLEFVSDRIISFKLSAAYSLTKNNIILKTRTSTYGEYFVPLSVSKVTTTDNISYSVEFYFKSNEWGNGSELQLSIDGQPSAVIEKMFIRTVAKYEIDEVIKGYVGSEIIEPAIVEFANAVGYCDTTIKSGTLPEGLKMVPTELGVKIIGIPQSDGVSDVVFEIIDEIGNVLTKKVYFVIGACNRLHAKSVEKDVFQQYSATVYFSNRVYVSGGSGEYNYEIIGEKYNSSISTSGYVSGSINKQGTYNIQIKVTDKNIPELSITTMCTIIYNEPTYITGKVVDINNNPVHCTVNCVVYGKDGNEISFYTTTDYNTGEYSLKAIDGVASVYANHKYTEQNTYVQSRKIVGDTKIENIVMPLYRVELQNENIYSDIEWLDENNNVLGTGKYIHVLPGEYNIMAYPAEKDFLNPTYQKASFSVTDKSIKVSSQNDERKADIYTISLNETYIADVFRYNMKMVRFIPTETAKYQVCSPNTCIYGVLTDANAEYLDGGYDKSGTDVLCEYTLEKGKTYYIGVKHDINATSLHEQDIHLVIQKAK